MKFRDRLKDRLRFMPIIVPLGRVEGLGAFCVTSLALNRQLGRPYFLTYVSRIYRVVLIIWHNSSFFFLIISCTNMVVLGLLCFFYCKFLSPFSLLFA